jgi:hypothetical protein
VGVMLGLAVKGAQAARSKAMPNIHTTLRFISIASFGWKSLYHFLSLLTM